MSDIWYNENRNRGKNVKKHCLIKNGYFAPYPNLRRDGAIRTAVLVAPLVFPEKGNPVTTKRKQEKSIQKPRRLPPIVVVPDKTYIDDTGNVIPTDVILIADSTMYMKMQIALEVWGKEPLGIPGQRGIIEG